MRCCARMVWAITAVGLRRDLERIIDMNTGVFPNLRFGTYREFFALAEAIKDKLPVVEGELNFVFTGCYTSQSRIKMANKVAENALGEAELFQAFSHTAADAPAAPARMAEAWQKVLFNQFHDIIPGSGIIDTGTRHGYVPDGYGRSRHGEAEGSAPNRQRY